MKPVIFAFAAFAAAFVWLVPAPAQQPAEGYLLGPDDRVSVNVRDVKEIEFKPALIDAAGNLELPYVGKLRAAGLSTGDLAKAIAERLKDYINDPNVTVEVTDYGSQPVSVIGAVNKPGVYQLRGRKTLIEVLALAEGLRNDAGYSITITRQREWGAIPLPGATADADGSFSARASIAAIMDARSPGANIPVRPHDVIAIPRAEMVYVVGCVRKPGGFVLGEKESITVLQAVSMAEGLDHAAASRDARIIRTVAGAAKPSEIPVNVEKILANKEPDQGLQSSDILFVPTSATKNAALRSVEVAIQMATGIVIWRR